MSFMDSIAQFHFLRPLWLFALLIVPFLAWYAQKKEVFSSSDWSKAIQPELLKHLMMGQKTAKVTQHTLWYALIAMLLVTGLAGPSWEKKPQPLHQPSDNLAIVLDLSLSMLASDQKPDRLTRAKHKLRDLLNLRKEGNTALIVYSGDSHVVTPLTDDTNTLQSMLPALDPFIMPAMGSQPTQAIAQAIEVLQNGGANQGRILLITDGVETSDLPTINQLLSDTNYPLSILAIGTEEGGPISIPERGYLKDKGSVIIPKTNFGLLAQLAAENNGAMEPIGLSDSDLESLGAAVSSDFQSANTPNKSDTNTHDDELENNSGLFDQWHDEGYWFALLLIPIVLISYRRGAFSLLVFLAFSLNSNESMAFEWNDLWKTQDQQAMELVNQDPAKAAELFEDPQWKASAQYKAQNFEAAQQTFAAHSSAQALYNQANALAQQQKFEDAIAAYDEALNADPTLEDAQFNKALIEKFLEEQPPQDQQSDENSESDDSDSEKSDSDSSDSKESDSESSDSENADSQDSEQSNNQGDPNQDEAESQEESSPSDADKEPSEEEQSAEQKAQQNSEEQSQQDQTQEQQAQAAEADELTDEETQAFEQWMRRVPDDPGGLLRRKFSQQYQQRGQQRQEGQPIW